MKHDFEYMNQSDSERLAMLESKAAELERRLGQVTPEYGIPESPAQDYGTMEFAAINPPPGGTGHDGAVHGGAGEGHRTGGFPAAGHRGAATTYRETRTGRHEAATGPHEAGTQRFAATGTEYHAVGPDYQAGDPVYRDAEAGNPEAASGYRFVGGVGFPGGQPTSYLDAGTGGYTHPGASGYPDAGVGGPDERTEALINRGRRHAQRRGLERWLAHWRAIAIGFGAVAVVAIVVAVILPGGGGAWPASVARVQSEIAIACDNPNVVSEPSQVNFACAKDTRQILWVFSLLTSGDNPNFTDQANGRKGLEPITPAQGGDIAWSLNLHHPYDPASPTDSLEVAARAINNIIGGATLTGANGAPVVQPGLESNPANCARYTGSSALVTKQGFPALCALPVSTSSGQAALVSDVFQRWMVGMPTQIATEAGVLFENADNPGNPQVQSILNTLPASGL
jgi:hypothetical protein